MKPQGCHPFHVGEPIRCANLPFPGCHLTVGNSDRVIRVLTDPETGHWMQVRRDDQKVGSFHASNFKDGGDLIPATSREPLSPPSPKAAAAV